MEPQLGVAATYGPWEEVLTLLTDLAESDLSTEPHEVRPTLVAYRGEELIGLLTLRPFAKGAHAEPIIELLALTAPLGADRYALSMSGRVWSLDDPVPPVTAEGDLRQRAVIIHRCDGGAEPPALTSRIVPFAPAFDGPRFGEPVDLDGGEGWLAEVLRRAVAMRDRMRTGEAPLAAQLHRCMDLGHDVVLGPEPALQLFDAFGEVARRRGWPGCQVGGAPGPTSRGVAQRPGG